MILVTGAASSGKSAFAEKLLADFGGKRRVYVATMIPWDEECRERIRAHRKMRAGKGFETVECFVDLDRLPVRENSAVLLECLSNLAANEMYREDSPDGSRRGYSAGGGAKEPDGADMAAEQTCGRAAKRIMEGIRALTERTEALVIVTNEVFSDGERYSGETIQYQRMLGQLNRRLAAMADQVYEVVCGIPIAVKG